MKKMHKLCAIIFFGSFFISHIILPAFPLSKAEEFQLSVGHVQGLYPTTARVDIVKNLQDSCTDKIYNNVSVNALSLDSLASQDPEIQKIGELLQDVSRSFKVLKRKMNIPKEVRLFYILDNDSGENALYDMYDRRVYIGKEFFNDTPSYCLFKLIHELTHVQQHQRLGLYNMMYTTSSFDQEREADTKAAQAISCPVCMQIIQDQWSTQPGRTSLGYLPFASILFYRVQKKATDVCRAHAVDSSENREINRLLPSVRNESRKNKLEADFDIPSLQDRLSSVRFAK